MLKIQFASFSHSNPGKNIVSLVVAKAVAEEKNILDNNQTNNIFKRVTIENMYKIFLQFIGLFTDATVDNLNFFAFWRKQIKECELTVNIKTERGLKLLVQTSSTLHRINTIYTCTRSTRSTNEYVAKHWILSSNLNLPLF